MKLRFTLLVSLTIVAILIGVAYSENRQTTTSITNAKQSLQQATDQLAKQRKANDQFITEYNSLWEQCEKGVVNYNLVPTATKTQATMPNCGLSIVQ